MTQNDKIKFDVIIANPPYQNPGNERNPLYPKFVQKAIDVCKENGIVAVIHPPAWRKSTNKLKDIICQKKVEYLEMHNGADGQKTFGVGTSYDWYVLRNSKSNNDKTKVLDQNGVLSEYDISSMPFIPSAMIAEISKIVSKNNEEKVEVIHSYSAYETRKPHMSKEKVEVLYSRSAYGSDKKHMSKEKTGEFCYPCVHATCVKETKYWYSNTNTNGHFGVKKVVIGLGGAKNAFYDFNGEFGMTQDVFGIEVDSDIEGNGIVKAFRNEEFQNILNSITLTGFKVDKEAIAQFRKDFWKDFVICGDFLKCEDKYEI